MSSPEAKFKINIKEGIVEIEGNEPFVERHVDKFEEICKTAIEDAMAKRIDDVSHNEGIYSPMRQINRKELRITSPLSTVKANNKHSIKQSLTLLPIPVDLKTNENKIGLREFYNQKRPANHYEKTVVFVYYLTKLNKQLQVKFGEILSCYEEVDEKKPSVIDIVKNSIRYKGWLEQGSDKFTTRLTISGENFVKFDLPQNNKDPTETVVEQSSSNILCT
jgi:hypothetical protein